MRWPSTTPSRRGPARAAAVTRSLDEPLGETVAADGPAVAEVVVDAEMPRELEPEQVLALAEAVLARYRALIIADAGLGLRPGELFGLTTDRVDFLRRTVRVDQQMVRIRGEGVQLTSKLKPQAAYRTLPLPDVVGQALAAHMQAFPPHPELGSVGFQGVSDQKTQQPQGIFARCRSRA